MADLREAKPVSHKERAQVLRVVEVDLPVKPQLADPRADKALQEALAYGDKRQAEIEARLRAEAEAAKHKRERALATAPGRASRAKGPSRPLSAVIAKPVQQAERAFLDVDVLRRRVRAESAGLRSRSWVTHSHVELGQ